MERNFETVLVEQCAPVLAGLKPAGLFLHKAGARQALLETVSHWNAQLNSRGVKVLVLRECPAEKRYLIYVYREKKLHQLFAQAAVQSFLQREGYHLPAPGEDSCAVLLPQLALRLNEEGEFPHEIGIFLGYPLADVEGFIRHRGQNFTCCGYWKSYSDPTAARQLFAKLKKCTTVYLRLFHSGTSILRLTVAA